MICDDTSAQTFLDIVFKGRSPFSGKSPGAGWSLLSASSIDGQMSDDPDGRFKPFSFLPLARAKGESLDLFGVRLVPGVVQPCVWSRGRRSLVDCSSIVSLDQLSRPLALDHVRQFTKSFYGELSNGPTPANRGDDFLSICVEPLSPRLEATTRECEKADSGQALFSLAAPDGVLNGPMSTELYYANDGRNLERIGADPKSAVSPGHRKANRRPHLDLPPLKTERSASHSGVLTKC